MTAPIRDRKIDEFAVTIYGIGCTSGVNQHYGEAPLAAEAALDQMLTDLAAKRGCKLVKDETQCPH